MAASVGDAVGVEDAVAVGDAVDVGDAVGVGDAVAVGDAVGVGVGVGLDGLSLRCCIRTRELIPHDLPKPSRSRVTVNSLSRTSDVLTTTPAVPCP
jgi:hypothetical protein